MVTYNSRNLKPGDWEEFRSFISKLKTTLGARAWAANLEESLNASDSAQRVYHCHAYFIWMDGAFVRVWTSAKFGIIMQLPTVQRVTGF
eukprot:5840697-Karenia_brevis.AAC.1